MDPIERVLAFWFEGADDPAGLDADHPAFRRWFRGGAELDATIHERFADDVARARSGELDGWSASPRGALALVILLDQFPRHLFRGDDRAYASDERAAEIARAAIASGADERLSIPERIFVYLPLQHSERLADHDVTIERFAALLALARERHPALVRLCEIAVTAEREHVDDLRRFGRYPYRNAPLGRPSTPDELEYLRRRG